MVRFGVTLFAPNQLNWLIDVPCARHESDASLQACATIKIQKCENLIQKYTKTKHLHPIYEMNKNKSE